MYVCYLDITMAEFYRSSNVSSASTDCVEELGLHCCERADDGTFAASNHSSSRALPQGLEAKRCAEGASDNHHNRTKLKRDFGVLPESAGQRGLDVERSADLRVGKKRQTSRSGRETSTIFSFPWSDSDDDFREAEYSIPLARRVPNTSEDSVTRKSSQTHPDNSQHVETSDQVSRRRKGSLVCRNADLNPASKTEQSRGPIVSRAAGDDDEFGVRSLVDSFLDNPSPTEQQNDPGHGETSSHNPCKKKKFPEVKRKLSAERRTNTLLSPLSATFMMDSASNAGRTGNELQTGVTSDDITSMWDYPVDNNGTEKIVKYCPKSEDTKTLASCSHGSVESGARGNGKRKRLTQKRQRSEDDCFNGTFNAVDAQNDDVSQAIASQHSSTAVFTDSYVTDSVEFPKHVGDNSKRRKGRDIGVNVTGSESQDTECKEDYQNKTSVSVGNLPAATSSMPGACARSTSAMVSNPCYRKKPGLWPTSSLGSDNGRSGSGSCVTREAKVQRSLARSRSNAGFIFNGSEDESRDGGSNAAVENSAENSAVHGRMNTEDSSSNYRMVRKRRYSPQSRGSAGGRHQKTSTTAASDGGSGRGHLKRRVPRGRKIPFDEDDEDNNGSAVAQLPCHIEDSCTSRNSTHTAASANDILVGGSEDKETRNQQTVDRQVRATDVDHTAGSCGSTSGRRQRVTARMSTGGMPRRRVSG